MQFKRPYPFADILRVPPEHEDIDRELLNWARWARGGGGSGASSPMFRMFRSNFARGGYGELTMAPPVETPRALAMERAIRLLPDLHRDLLRGWYVGNMAPMALCRRLAIAAASLTQTLHDARTMLRNAMAGCSRPAAFDRAATQALPHPR